MGQNGEKSEFLSKRLLRASIKDSAVFVDLDSGEIDLNQFVSKLNSDCSVLAIEQSSLSSQRSQSTKPFSIESVIEELTRAFSTEVISEEYRVQKKYLTINAHIDQMCSLIPGIFEKVQELNIRQKIFISLRPIPDAKGTLDNLVADYQWLRSNNFRVFGISDTDDYWIELGTQETLKRILYLDYILCIPAPSVKTVTCVLHNGGLNGAERAHLEFVEQLIEQGCMVRTLVSGPDGGILDELRLTASESKVIRPLERWVKHKDDSDPLPLSFSELVSFELLGMLLAQDPDFIVTQTGVIAQAAVAAKMLNKPHIWSIHEFGDLDHGLAFPMSRKNMGEIFQKLSTIVVTNSKAVSEHFFGKNNSAIVLYPMKLSDYSSDGGEYFSTEYLRVGVIGSLQEGKGHADLILAARALKSQNKIILLDFRGSGEESDLFRLESLAIDNGVETQCKFSGFIENKKELYKNLDVVVVSSQNEAFGRVPFEAAAAGIPVIYARSGALMEYMIEGVTGLAYAPNDYSDLAKVIAQLSNDSKMRGKLADQAFHSFQQFLGNGRTVEHLLGVLGESQPNMSQLSDIVHSISPVLAKNNFWKSDISGTNLTAWWPESALNQFSPLSEMEAAHLFRQLETYAQTIVEIQAQRDAYAQTIVEIQAQRDAYAQTIVEIQAQIRD